MNELTDTQLVELLAQREGWTWDEEKVYWPKPSTHWWPRHKQTIDCGGLEDHLFRILPNYSDNLNALQPILATLTEEEWTRLDKDLAIQFAYGRKKYMKSILTLKPSQLARCIVRAIGKWREGGE